MNKKQSLKLCSSKPCQQPVATMLVRNYGDKREKRCCSGCHKKCKTFVKDHMVRLKIISLYIYKDLRLRSNESRGHYREDGNLAPSPRCGFSFEASLRL